MLRTRCCPCSPIVLICLLLTCCAPRALAHGLGFSWAKGAELGVAMDGVIIAHADKGSHLPRPSDRGASWPSETLTLTGIPLQSQVRVQLLSVKPAGAIRFRGLATATSVTFTSSGTLSVSFEATQLGSAVVAVSVPNVPHLAVPMPVSLTCMMFQPVLLDDLPGGLSKAVSYEKHGFVEVYYPEWRSAKTNFSVAIPGLVLARGSANGIGRSSKTSWIRYRYTIDAKVGSLPRTAHVVARKIAPGKLRFVVNAGEVFRSIDGSVSRRATSHDHGRFRFSSYHETSLDLPVSDRQFLGTLHTGRLPTGIFAAIKRQSSNFQHARFRSVSFNVRQMSVAGGDVKHTIGRVRLDFEDRFVYAVDGELSCEVWGEARADFHTSSPSLLVDLIQEMR